ncbi:MAG: LysR family transcriptional regulator [Verrucomicrobiota bacterium]
MRELHSFVVLAEQLHFGRAAVLLHLSQPALTKQIRKLEEELGSPLFERGRHGSRLSAFGSLFLHEARPVVFQFDQLLTRGRRAAGGEAGLLRIGFGFHTLELVPRLVVELRREAPAIEVTLRDMSTAEQTAALQSEQIDLGFVRLPVGSPLSSLRVIEDRLMLVSSMESQLPGTLSLEQCRHQPFVLISGNRSPGFYNHVLMLCAKHGFHPRIVQEVTEVTTALALVRAGLGVAIIPHSFCTTQFAGIRYHMLREREARWGVGAAWRKGDTNPLLHRFLGLLRSGLKSGPKKKKARA